MAYTTIDDPSAYFQTALYTGNESTNVITNDGNSDLQPDWWWGADRTGTNWNSVYDSSRGVTKQLNTNVTNSEYTVSNGMASFNSDGFTLGSHDNSNKNSHNHVAWQWKANGGTATATGSESGSNPAYSVQANTTAGFSVVTYTGTGSNGTVPHGLGVKPDWYIIKNRDNANANDGRWMVWHKSLEALHNYYSFMFLHLTNSRSEGTTVVNATPNTTTFALGDDGMINNDSEKYVAYCFAEKQGYSKFGSYTGNGNADGPFVYTGFKPAWVILKRSSGVADWNIFDNKRPGYNETNARLRANDTTAESTSDAGVDLLSNGFKCRLGSEFNASSTTNIYMAFAESPFVSSKGVPTTAR